MTASISSVSKILRRTDVRRLRNYGPLTFFSPGPSFAPHPLNPGAINLFSDFYLMILMDSRCVRMEVSFFPSAVVMNRAWLEMVKQPERPSTKSPPQLIDGPCWWTPPLLSAPTATNNTCFRFFRPGSRRVLCRVVPQLSFVSLFLPFCCGQAEPVRFPPGAHKTTVFPVPKLSLFPNWIRFFFFFFSHLFPRVPPFTGDLFLFNFLVA